MVNKGNSTIETSQIINYFFLWYGMNTWIETVRLQAYTDGLSPQVSILTFQFMSTLQALLWKTLYALCGASRYREYIHKRYYWGCASIAPIHHLRGFSKAKHVSTQMSTATEMLKPVNQCTSVYLLTVLIQVLILCHSEEEVDFSILYDVLLPCRPHAVMKCI